MIDTIVKNISTGYVPRFVQEEMHKRIKRFNVLVWHRRGGKTVGSLNEMVDKALNNNLYNPQYAYIAPTYKQAKRIAWGVLNDICKNLPGYEANKTELTVYIKRPKRIINGLSYDADEIKLMLIGSDDPEAIRGIYLDGAIFDEFAQCDPIVWGQIARPALADRKGWAIFIGTPKGNNHFYVRYRAAKESEEFAARYEQENNVKEVEVWVEEFEKKHSIYQNLPQVKLNEILIGALEEDRKRYSAYREYKASRNWFTQMYKASETGILDRDEMDEMKRDMTPDEVEQELECSFVAAIIGSYFGEIIGEIRRNNQITQVTWHPAYPVDTFWDLGVNDKTAIWFRQKVGPNWHYIDYYENNGKGVEHYWKVLKEKKYTYGKHVWPHDGRVKEFGSGQTRQEIALSLGLKTEIQPKQAISDRIQASRTRLRVSFFDSENCERGLECLYNYQREYDSKMRVYRNTPCHDWSSHGATAFGYSALDDRPGHFKEYYNELPRMADNSYNIFGNIA